MLDESELLQKVNTVIAPFGCVATELGPDSVGVQGDNRAYLPSVYVRFREGMTMEEIAEVSNAITNYVPGISRVLMEIS